MVILTIILGVLCVVFLVYALACRWIAGISINCSANFIRLMCGEESPKRRMLEEVRQIAAYKIIDFLLPKPKRLPPPDPARWKQ